MMLSKAKSWLKDALKAAGEAVAGSEVEDLSEEEEEDSEDERERIKERWRQIESLQKETPDDELPLEVVSSR